MKEFTHTSQENDLSKSIEFICVTLQLHTQ